MNRLPLDKIGLCTSSFCAVHCALAPLIILFSGSAGVLAILDSPVLEAAILMLTLGVGLSSFIPAYFRHRKFHVVVLFMVGLLLLISGDLSDRLWVQLGLSVSGAAVIAYSHFENLKLIRFRK